MSEEEDILTNKDDEQTVTTISHKLAKVPLECSWTLWYSEVPTGGGSMSTEEYTESLNNIGSFNTVQKFWRYFNNMPSLEKISARSNIYIFKENIQPKWEDDHNIHGGIWNIKTLNSIKAWEYLTLFAVGEKLSEGIGKDKINGIGVCLKPKGRDILQIWNENDQNQAIIKQRIIELFNQNAPNIIENESMFYTFILEKLEEEKKKKGMH